MIKITATYEGAKHCRVVHGPTGDTIQTDAPKDNNGKGEKFSPTDLVGAALASCILTVMGIIAERDGISLVGAEVTVEKHMQNDPRRIVGLPAKIIMPPGIPKDYRAKLEATARHCPVCQSLGADIKCTMEFIYPD